MQTIGQIISQYRKKANFTQPQLSEELAKYGINISHKAISRWEQDASEPSIKVFMYLCKILEIPDFYEEFFGYNPFSLLTPLNEEGRVKLTEYAELLRLSHKYDKTEPILLNTRKIKQFRLMASAGTGNFLDSDDYDLIEVGDEVPLNADFGIKLSGDSMEPRYVNHQVVWVHQQSTLQNGEIGIFCINEHAYCKKLQNDAEGTFLISLNSKYEPIKVTDNDEFTIFGKVIG